MYTRDSIKVEFTQHELALVRAAVKEKLGRSTDMDETNELADLAGYLEEGV